MKKFLTLISAIFFGLFLLNMNVYAYGFDKPFEIIDMRTTSQKVFMLQNGNYEFNYYSTPVHYWSGEGFKEFDFSIKENGKMLTTKGSNYIVSLPKILTSKETINLSYFNLYEMNVLFDDDLKESIFDYHESKYSHNEIKHEHNDVSNQRGVVSYNTRENTIEYEQNTTGIMHSYKINSIVDSFESKFYISTKNLKFIDNEDFEKVFINNFGIPIYQLGDQYILDNDGKYIEPIEIVVHKIDDCYEVTILYDFINLNSELAYPLYSVNSISNYLNNGPNYIRDKYVRVNNSGVYDNVNLLVGIDPIGHVFDPEMDPIHYEYKSFIELSLPNTVADNVISAQFKINKRGLVSNPLYNPKIFLERVTDKNYDQILGGTTTYNSNYIAYGDANKKTYNFNITNAVKSQISSSYELLLVLEGEPVAGYNFGLATFIASNDEGVNSPSYIIILSDLGTTPFGSAPQYIESTLTYQNCFGYVLGINDQTQLLWENGEIQWMQRIYDSEFDSIFNNVFVPAAIARMAILNYTARNINSLDSDIYSHERRIAFRIGDKVNEVYSDFHFMMQHNNGQWSHKRYLTTSVLLETNQDTETPNIWGYVNFYPFYYSWDIDFYYNSRIQYFAIYSF